jgi:hypothetical protein
LQLVEQSSQRLDVVAAEAASQLLVELDHGFQEAGVKRLSGACQLDLDGAAVDAATLSRDESCLLEAVEVAGQGRAFDPDRSREVELCAPRLALEGVQDQPDRDRAAAFGERVVEGTTDGL